MVKWHFDMDQALSRQQIITIFPIRDKRLWYKVTNILLQGGKFPFYVGLQ